MFVQNMDKNFGCTPRNRTVYNQPEVSSFRRAQSQCGKYARESYFNLPIDGIGMPTQSMNQTAMSNEFLVLTKVKEKEKAKNLLKKLKSSPDKM